MSLTITIFWAVTSGATYQACYKEAAQAQVCVSPSGTGKHDFTTLKDDTDYTFSYKENGTESTPVSYHTPQKKTPIAPNLQIVQQ